MKLRRSKFEKGQVIYHLMTPNTVCRVVPRTVEHCCNKRLVVKSLDGMYKLSVDPNAEIVQRGKYVPMFHTNEETARTAADMISRMNSVA
jgi:hypothetical protein